jgi:hypothetical protein
MCVCVCVYVCVCVLGVRGVAEVVTLNPDGEAPDFC